MRRVARGVRNLQCMQDYEPSRDPAGLLEDWTGWGMEEELGIYDVTVIPPQLRRPCTSHMPQVVTEGLAGSGMKRDEAARGPSGDDSDRGARGASVRSQVTWSVACPRADI